MSFTPRTLANGNVCCSESYALCRACEAHHAGHDANALGRLLQGYGSVVTDAAPLPYGPLRSAEMPEGSTERMQAMSEFRQQVQLIRATSRMASERPSASKVHLEPPASYDIAIARRRGNV